MWEDSGGYRGWGVGVGVITPPLVAENFVCSNSNSLVAITPPPPRGRREGGRGGWGRGGRRKFYLRVELIICIDPNEGEALKRGREGGRGAEGAEGNFT